MNSTTSLPLPARDSLAPFRRQTILCASLAVAFCATAMAQTVEQTITLQPGWNSVFLEVQPNDPSVGHVFSDPSISSVWEPKVRASTVAFIQNQNEAAFNRGGWAVYVPTNLDESINNDLYSVSANHAYLVKSSSDVPVTCKVSGTPSLRAQPFAPDTYTLRGFAVDPSTPPNFMTFFGASPAHYRAGGLTAVYRLNNATSNWELVGPYDPVIRGAAYWVYSAGASSYMGPLSAKPAQGDNLDFGMDATEQNLTLRNNTSNTMNVAISDLATGNRPLTYYFYTPANPVAPAWTALPQVYSLTVPPMASKVVRLGIRRSQMPSSVYSTVLEITDGNGMLLRVPVSAQREATTEPVVPGTIPVTLQAGLWVGDISVNSVAETYNNPTNTTPTRGTFDLRVILHVKTNGTTRLLRDVVEMFQNGTFTNNAAGQQLLDQPGQTVLLTDSALVSTYNGVTVRDGIAVGRRISTAGFDFDPPGGTNFLVMDGKFGVGNTISCAIILTPASPTNPFLHRYHPDHDNLDALYAPLSSSRPPEVYTIKRQIQMTFTPTDPANQTATDYGYNEIAGVFRETITGLHRNPLVTSGNFRLSRVSQVTVLNANQ